MSPPVLLLFSFLNQSLRRGLARLLIMVAAIAHPMVGAPSEEDTHTLVLTGANVIPGPREAAVRDATIVLQAGRIVALGARDMVKVPARARTIDCTGQTVVAGFWNCHVHFTEPKWDPAKTLPAAQLTAHLQRMLTRFGFTHAVDLASAVSNTVDLRSRIEAGEVRGPRVLTAGGALYPVNGIPHYVTDFLPANLVATLSTPKTTEEAVRLVRANFAAGADLLKLFLVTGVRHEGRIDLVNMEPAIAKAAADEAHRQGKLVFAHPSTIKGANLVIDAGVDVLAHAIQDSENWTPSLVDRLVKAHVALVPTLALFSHPQNFEGGMREVKSYVDAGGEVLFGTDIGFLTDYDDLAREFILLQAAGLSIRQILETLTTAPARRFNLADRAGRVAVGFQADLVILDGELDQDAKVFSQVRFTLRNGQIIYSTQE